MDVAAAAESIARRLTALGDPARAVNEKRYLKSDLVHLGVRMPDLRRVAVGAVRPLPPRDDLLALVDALWTARRPGGPVHELRMAAIEVLIRGVRSLEPGDLAVAERLIRESGYWVYVDGVAIKVVGALLVRFPGLATEIDRFAADDDFWIRRTALLALMPAFRSGDADLGRLSRYGDAMIGEREFFIRKALGWVLRELSKRDPVWVRDWVAARIDLVSGVTLREAVRYLAEQDADTLLAAYRSRRPRPRRNPPS